MGDRPDRRGAGAGRPGRPPGSGRGESGAAKPRNHPQAPVSSHGPHDRPAKVALLLKEYAPLLRKEAAEGPILDLACGRGQNGLFLAGLGLPVVLADRSSEALEEARWSASRRGLDPRFWEVDLEAGGDRLPEEHYAAILVFHYLHRPLIPAIRGAVRSGGVLIYETFTTYQLAFGRPRNPDYLLQPGELAEWFRDWETLHSYEGVLEDPPRAVAQIVCRKPGP